MIEKIGHYSLENPASVYDEEAMTALELAGRTAKKVNECVEAVNTGMDYLHTNLEKTVDDNIEEMANDGTLETKLVKAIASGKVGKGENEAISMKMLSQEVKQAMTGGSVAVVGAGAVNTTNIAADAVTADKLAPYLQDVRFHSVVENYNKPLLKIDTVNSTMQVNADVVGSLYLYKGNEFKTFTVSDVSCDMTTYYEKTDTFGIFYDPNTNVFYLNSNIFLRPYFKNMWAVGFVNTNRRIVEFVFPVEINGIFYNGRDRVNSSQLPNCVGNYAIQMHRYHGELKYAAFNFDQDTKTFTKVMGGSYNIFDGKGNNALNLDTVTYKIVDIDGNHAVSYYDPQNNEIIFQAVKPNVPGHWVYLGYINFNNVHLSNFLLPFSVNNTYLYSPKRSVREEAHLVYVARNNQTESCAYIDYTNGKLVFPSVINLYIATESGLITIVKNTTPTDYVVDLPHTTYNYIVGGSNGLTAIDANTFLDIRDGTHADHAFIFGYIIKNQRQSCLNFKTVHGGSLSVIGDSISSLEGYVPEGYSTYYGNVEPEMMWWGHLGRACGLYRNTICAHSGARVTNTKDTTINGVTMASNLSNGTDPENVIVYIGINDWANNVPLGTYDGKGAIPTTRSTFREAYALMLNTIMTNYPKAKIYACTLPACEHNTTDIGRPDVNTTGVYLFEYNEAIRQIATRMHVEVIDLETCAIHQKNGSTYMYDYNESTGKFVHPNAMGHKEIAKKMIRTINQEVY